LNVIKPGHGVDYLRFSLKRREMVKHSSHVIMHLYGLVVWISYFKVSIWTCYTVVC